MNVSVREMQLEEVGAVIDYFHNATPEHLELLGVDPTRLPTKAQWKQLYERDYSQPREQRKSLLVLWQLDGRNLGFSSADKIKYGEEAYMHLHVFDSQSRRSGHGATRVRQSVGICFRLLALKRLCCEPDAFNAAPNRTDASEIRLPVRQDAHDCAGPAELPSSRYAMGSRKAIALKAAR